MKTVLIIDDFETTLFTVAITLQTHGYQAIKAKSGDEALKLLDGREINLIISDYNMPGMTGLELTEKIRTIPNYKSTPILILSTDTSPEKKNNAFKKGVTGWVKKPYQLDDFLKIIAKAIK